MSRLSLVARIAGERVAFDAALIEAVVDLGDVVVVPFAPPHIAGLAAIRSKVVTVVDAAASVGLVADGAPRRAIVAELDGHRYAIAVDSVDDVRVLPEAHAVDQALLSAGWRGAVTGRVALESDGEAHGGFALCLDPRRLVGGATLNGPVTSAA